MNFIFSNNVQLPPYNKQKMYLVNANKFIYFRSRKWKDPIFPDLKFGWTLTESVKPK